MTRLEQLGHRRLVAHRVLAQVEPRDAQAEERDLLAQAVQLALGEQRGAVGLEAFG